MNNITKKLWERKTDPIQCQLEDVPIEGDFEEWLSSYASSGDYLLAHALDGVIWGRFTNERLVTSHELASDISPPLRLETLQQLRLFNEHSELLLWGEDNVFRARRMTDGAGKEYAAFDEPHILWGTKGQPLNNHFTLLEDGAQGLRHIVPINAQTVNQDNIRVCLRVRHYIDVQEETGVNYIAYSRLAGLEVVTYEPQQ